jgi:LysR family glycine cleavage system transcriptional activator
MNPPLHDDIRFPSIDGLRAFEAVARLGSLERAAAALNISASAVGKRINTLEDLLGNVLLDRSSKPVALSAAGKEYLEPTRAALALLATMPQHQRRAQRQQRLRVCSPPTFARQILVPALPEFNRLRPDLELELLLSIPFLDEAGPLADVEIRNGDATELGSGGEAGAVAQLLMQDCVTPMIAPSLLDRLPALQRPADLACTTLLRTPLQAWSPWLRAAGLDWPEPQQGTRFVDLGLTLEAAACGQGVVLGRPSLAEPFLRNGALLRLFELQVPAATPYYLLSHSAADAAQAFAQWLMGHCRALAERSSALR